MLRLFYVFIVQYSSKFENIINLCYKYMSKIKRGVYMKSNLYAGVDIGSGSARLAICEVNENKAKTKYFELFGHSLGNDNRNLGYFSDNSMQNAIDMFKSILDKCEIEDVEEVEFSATEAIRAADNSKEFLEKVKTDLNIDIRILDEEEEATFAYLGATKLFDTNSKNVLVMDIGRGSVEFALGSAKLDKPTHYESHKIGTMVFKNRLNDKSNLQSSFNSIVTDVENDILNTLGKWNVKFAQTDQIISLGMSLFTYGYLNNYTEKEMVKAEGLELSLNEVKKYADEQLEFLEQGICSKQQAGVISQGDIPVLATLIGLMNATGLNKVMLGRTRIPQGIALQLANK